MKRHPRPTQAFILAAGLATRLRPLTLNTPKACLPVWGRPALHHVLDLLASWGVREALVNLHHEPLAVLEAGRAWKGPVRLNFSFEPVQPLGTGGALRHGAWFFKGDPFWLINADVLADLDPEPLLRAFHGPARPLAALWMVPGSGPRTVRLENGFVADFATPAPGAPDTATFSGLHLVHPEVVAHLPPEPFCSVIAAYRRAMAAGRRIAGVTLPGAYWEDIGLLSDYLGAHARIADAWKKETRGGRLYDPAAPAAARALRRRGVRVEGFAAGTEAASIGRGAFLHNAVLWPGSRVAPGAAVENAVVAERVRVRGAVTGMATMATVFPEMAGFLSENGFPPSGTALLPLGPRGSDRAFYRLQGPDRSAILVHYGRERHENTLYAGHTRFLLECGIRVPRLYGQDVRRRLLLFEDAGRRDLLAALKEATGPERTALYLPPLALAARLHTAGTAAAHERRLRMVAGFSPKLYRWERLYFVHHFLQKRLRLPPAITSPVAADLRRVADRLQALPRVLIHRDLQSTNILLTPEGPLLIDYQGMRYGAAAYDVASLLADPYVSLSEGEQAALLAEYGRQAGADLPEELFWTAAVQRLAQALGAYARLGALPGTADFARHIPPALAMMRRAVTRLPPGFLPHLAMLLEPLSP